LDGEATRREILTPEEKRRRREVATLLGRDGHMVAFETRAGKALGNNSARFSRQLLFWEGKGKSEDRFIYKTADELEEETNLTRGQQQRVRQKLRDLGILEEERRGWRGGAGNTLWFRLNLERLLEVVGPYAEEPREDGEENVIGEDEARGLEMAVHGTARDGTLDHNQPEPSYRARLREAHERLEAARARISSGKPNTQMMDELRDAMMDELYDAFRDYHQLEKQKRGESETASGNSAV
jgi:hypothetical protein